MNNLFNNKSAKKNLFAKAYIVSTSQDIIKNVIANLCPELTRLNTENTYNIYINSKLALFEVSLCSQNNQILTLFKLNFENLKKEITDSLIDKNILLSNDQFKLKIYYK
jgi:hypothetical protein